jgi:hypothetical protein
MLTRLALFALVLALSACGPIQLGPGRIDCGSSDQTPGGHDVVGRECVWDAYTRHLAVSWNVTTHTEEGDPIPLRLRSDSAGIVLTRDTTADKWSSAADRRVWTWKCGAMTMLVWATDASRYSFALSNCVGDGAATAFP